ncbi:alpha/beta hydrolase [Rothia sp. AR01]|uniref:Alpha/beta hydrolase n=1 Tax=Rothia santali TaxID=2949643 RepID=A0A9X2HGI5_9MICC|nr:alpha/beta hydrolase [Rothia santali]MCP3425311.1 alpha/beta hydrolase [Rothia santali]
MPGPAGDVAAPGLAEDAAALRRALAESDGAVVVGHSYGGTVMAEGADHPSARHLVYITSYLPEAGTSQAEIMAEEPDPVVVEPGPDGALRIAGYDPETFGRRFWQDLDDDAARRGAWERVTAQSAAAFTTPTTRAAWQGVPSTYLVCVRDGSTSLALQRRHAARATASFDLETGHHPFLSAPEAVAERLVEILGAVREA